MNFLYFLYVVVNIAKVSSVCYSLSGTINSNINKKLEEQVKQLSLKIQKLEKESRYLLKEMKMLPLKTNINFEYWKLQPLQPRRDCL